MTKHARDSFFVVGEGVLEFDQDGRPSTRQPLAGEELRRFRFSRIGPEGPLVDEATRTALAEAITVTGIQADASVPAGFTYLGQFVDHDLTMDRTDAQLGEDVNLDELLQGRSPALDLDSVYGRGPTDRHDRIFYQRDGVQLKVGRTSATTFPDDRVNVELEGFDLPRAGGTAGTRADRRKPLIPDLRNDENLAVAQTHLAFIRFHNRLAAELALTGLTGGRLFAATHDEVVRHYQWMLRTDFLPRIVDPAIVADVFAHGRRFFEAPGRGHGPAGEPPTMPIEFSVAAYRLGHSMVRGAYQWNRVFNTTGPGGLATLLQLFTFTGVSGNFQPGAGLPELDDPNSGTVDSLPTNWIVDFRRLYDFTEAGRPDLAAPASGGNVAKRIDTLMVDPLAQLPAGTFGGRGSDIPPVQRNLAFRNLTRANMVRLGTGQQLAKQLGATPLTEAQILDGNQGAGGGPGTPRERGGGGG
jgi:hypothetical protein